MPEEKDVVDEVMLQKEFSPEGEEEKEIIEKLKKKGIKETKSKSKPPSKAERTVTFNTQLKREATQELTKRFRHLLGSSTDVVFHKRDPKFGKKQYLVTLDTSDLAEFTNLNEYVEKFLVPKFGRGEYIAQFRVKQTDGPDELHEERIDTGIEAASAESQLDQITKIHDEIRKLEQERAAVMQKHFAEQIDALENKIKDYQERGYSEAALGPLRDEIYRLKERQISADRQLQWANLLLPVLTPFLQNMFNKGKGEQDVLNTTINLLNVLESKRQDTEKIISAMEKIGQNKSLVDQLVEQVTTNPGNIKKAIDFMLEAKKTVGDKIIDNILGNPSITGILMDRIIPKKEPPPPNPLDKLVDSITKNPNFAMQVLGKISGADELKAEINTLKQVANKDKISETIETMRGLKEVMEVINPPKQQTPPPNPMKQMLDTIKEMKELGDVLKPMWGVSETKWGFISSAFSKLMESLAPTFQKFAEGYASQQASKLYKMQLKMRSLPKPEVEVPPTAEVSERPETPETVEAHVMREEKPKEVKPKTYEEMIINSMAEIAKAGFMVDHTNLTIYLTKNIKNAIESGQIEIKEDAPEKLLEAVYKIIPDYKSFEPAAKEMVNNIIRSVSA